MTATTSQLQPYCYQERWGTDGTPCSPMTVAPIPNRTQCWHQRLGGEWRMGSGRRWGQCFETDVSQNTVTCHHLLTHKHDVGWFFVLDLHFLCCTVVASSTKIGVCVLNKLESYLRTEKDDYGMTWQWKLLSTIILWPLQNTTVTYDITMTLLRKYYSCTTAIYRSADYTSLHVTTQWLQSYRFHGKAPRFADVL